MNNDKTKAVNLYKSSYDIYCGRGKGIKNNPLNCKIGEYGWLGNPISIMKSCLICKHIHKKGGDTLNCFEKYLNQRLKDINFKTEFIKLRNKKLGCFCKPKPCHVDIIIKKLNDLYNE